MDDSNAEIRAWGISSGQVLSDELHEIEKARALRQGIKQPADTDTEGEPVADKQSETDSSAKSQLLGLAFSGGGIRSATFNLGVLQALAEMNLLPRFDYLSTVSGGGYIGSWFISWIRRFGLSSVQNALRPDWRAEETENRSTESSSSGSSQVEPGPIRFLRQYSNYLTPQTGWFGADTWTVVSIYLRNLLLNLVILMLALSVMLLIPRFIAAFGVWIRASATLPLIFIVLSWIGLAVALILISLNLRSFVVGSNQHYPRFASQGGVQKWVVLPLFIGAILATMSIWSLLLQGRLTQPLFSIAPGWLSVPVPVRWAIVSGITYPLVWTLAWLVSGIIHRSRHQDRESHNDTDDSAWPKTIGWGIPAGLVAGLMFYGTTEIFRNLTATPFPDLLGGLPVNPHESSIWPTLTWGVPLIIGALTMTMILHIGLMGLRLEDAIREWMSRVGAWLLIYTLGWIGLFSIAVYGPATITWLQEWAAALGTGWILSTISGILAGRSAQTGSGGRNTKLELVALIAPYIFVAGLLLLLAHAVDNILPLLADDRLPIELSRNSPFAAHLWDHWRVMTETSNSLGWVGLLLCLLGVGLVTLLLAWRVDINEFSMHLLYRNRLVRCYLGASNRKPRRQAHPFTGFDPNDDVELHRLWKPELQSLRVGIPEGGTITYKAVSGDKPAQRCIRKIEAAIAWGDEEELLLLLEGEPHERISISIVLHPALEGQPALPAGSAIEYESLAKQWRAFPQQGSNLSELITTMRPEGQIRIRLRKLPNGSADITAAYLDHCYDGPYPIINTALNLVGGDELAWQQRKATSFILSPLYCGYDVVQASEDSPASPGSLADHAYCTTGSYASQTRRSFRKNKTTAIDVSGRPISLGTAMAISGAAASPNMGYHSSAPLAFLMTVFNVRLGWWVGNPRRNDTWKRSGPRNLMIPLLLELFGLTSDTGGYVYLSDGGHFENLGIYELVRRRCRFIVACDGSADPDYTFSDLGNAIEKCRADMGIDIEIDIEPLRQRNAEGYSRWHCAVGKIRYDLANDREAVGTILYIKTSLTGDEPTDVLRYAAANPGFPHQSTADQWFDESQFESYRMLGYHAAGSAFRPAGSAAEVSRMNTQSLFLRLRQYWYPPSEGVRESFSKHSQTLRDIFNRMAGSADLRFLDQQIYPEWKEFVLRNYQQRNNTNDERARIEASSPDFMFQLPQRYEELRSGFYICTEMIQLMEDVYLDLHLEQDYDHPDNRGWVNLFRHWSWSGMFRATWMVSASTYGARFQDFCKRHLDLTLGRVVVTSFEACCKELGVLLKRKDTDGVETTQLLPPDPLTLLLLSDQFARTVTGHRMLNPVELKEIRHCHDRWMEYACQQDRVVRLPNRLYLLRLLPHIGTNGQQMPEESLVFTFGFVLVHEEENNCHIMHFRVQDHLRTMGLGRQGLLELMLHPHYDNAGNKLLQQEFSVVDEASSINDRSDLIQFRQMFDSVRDEIAELGLTETNHTDT